MGAILGLYRDNGKENGNYYSILGLYRDNGKENGNYYNEIICTHSSLAALRCFWITHPLLVAPLCMAN